MAPGWEILDPYRDNVMKVLDQGAVCLNIDASKAGKTLTADELAKLDASNKFGDIAGVGPGRNWAHVNSVDYDPTTTRSSSRRATSPPS